MRNFVLGFAAGIATYHYVLLGNNKELVSEVRGLIKTLDDRLADAEKNTSEPKTGTSDTVKEYEARPSRSETPPPSPPQGV
jgi:hypothetical protein